MKKVIVSVSKDGFGIVIGTPEIINKALRERLIAGIVHFSFTKKDGSLRDAFGTLHKDRITITAGESATPNPLVGTYFDLEANAWRSYTIANLVAIY